MQEASNETSVPLGSEAVTLRKYFFLAGLFFAAEAVVLLLGVSQTPPTQRKEMRVWAVVNEMYATGDYLVPRMEGQPHLTKPPLYYWLAVLCGKAAGEMNLLVFRLPSIFAALAVLALVLAWGYAAGGRRASLLGGALLVCMGRFPVWGRLGTFEMLLGLFSLGALYLFFLAYERGKYGAWPAACGLFALAFLTKGTPALLTVALPCAAWVALRRQLRFLRRPGAWAYALAAVALSLSWYVVLVWKSAEARAIFKAQILLPFGIETEEATATHYERFYYYAGALFEIAAPVSLLIAVLAKRAWTTRCWRDNAFLRFLFVVFLTVILGFSCLPGKQKHYVLVVFAPLAVLTAESLLHGLGGKDRLTVVCARAVAAIWGGAVVFVGIAAAFLGAVVFGWDLSILAAFTAATVASGIGLIVSEHKLKWRAAAVTGVLGTMLMYGFVLGSYMVWDQQFEAGTVYLRADYDAARWERNFREYPWLRKIFNEKEQHKFVPYESEDGGSEPRKEERTGENVAGDAGAGANFKARTVRSV